MPTLLLFAVLLQSADLGLSCQALQQPGARETNPLLGSTCGQIALRKTAYFLPLALPSARFRKGWSIGLIGGGALGVGFTLALK